MLIVAIRGPGRGSLALRAGMLVIARRVALIGFEVGVLKRRFYKTLEVKVHKNQI